MHVKGGECKDIKNFLNFIEYLSVNDNLYRRIMCKNIVNKLNFVVFFLIYKYYYIRNIRLFLII
jgi:hypothetical protein